MKIPEEALAGRTENECVDVLQLSGIISDNVVFWSDVGNQEEAIAWLTQHPEAR